MNALATVPDDLSRSGERPVLRLVHSDWRQGDLRVRIRPVHTMIVSWRLLMIALAIFLRYMRRQARREEQEERRRVRLERAGDRTHSRPQLQTRCDSCGKRGRCPLVWVPAHDGMWNQVTGCHERAKGLLRRQAELRAKGFETNLPIANFLNSARELPAPWAEVEGAVARVFGLVPDALEEDGEARDLFAETLERVHRATMRPGEPILNLASYAFVVASNVLADAWERRRLDQEHARQFLSDACRGTFQAKRATPRLDPGSRMRPLPLNDEDAKLARDVDARRDPKPLSAAFDREALWAEVHALCTRKWRDRFGDKTEARDLAPEEIAWRDLLAQPHMPPSMKKVTTKTTAVDVVDAARERAKKAVQRAANHKSKDSSSVSPGKDPLNRLLFVDTASAA